MKKLFLIALIALPFTSEAVCFKTFSVSGYGINMIRAQEDLEAQSQNMCAVDDYNWIQKVSEITFTDLGENSIKPIQATALYRCCSAW